MAGDMAVEGAGRATQYKGRTTFAVVSYWLRECTFQMVVTKQQLADVSAAAAVQIMIAFVAASGGLLFG